MERYPNVIKFDKSFIQHRGTTLVVDTFILSFNLKSGNTAIKECNTATLKDELKQIRADIQSAPSNTCGDKS